VGNRGRQVHRFYAHGKLLLSGEYAVLEGATALAVPTTVGQLLQVQYRPSFDPYLVWKSYDRNKQLWLEATFEFWHFDLVNTRVTEEILFLQKVLRYIRQLNAHFLRDGVHIDVETHLEFSRQWGLGASSTFLHICAQWACVSPFDLLFGTMEGSGYDMACAQAFGPIIYKKTEKGPKWSLVDFSPSFQDSLIFLYLGKKQNSREAIAHYRKEKICSEELKKSHWVDHVSELTENILKASSLQDFQYFIQEHENLLSSVLQCPSLKEQRFLDFPGAIKSLGAWGGDFALVASDLSYEHQRAYFLEKGYDVLIPFRELVYQDSPYGDYEKKREELPNLSHYTDLWTSKKMSHLTK
jgi:mevalonate kinase